jgi:endonuclease YncB( thermonuclease family)
LRSSRIRLAGVWLALLLATGAAADTRTCRVAAIADADSLTCLLGGARTEVRLDEIDAPEREQRYGSESRQSLTSLCMNRQATVQVHNGMAWVYDHYVKNRSLYNDQTLARSQSRGLWADAGPTA